MKKVLTIIALVVLVVGLPVLAACGQSLTENDIATIRGLIARVDSLEAQQASLASKVANLQPGTLETDLETAKTDIAGIRSDLTALKTDLEKLKSVGDESGTPIDSLLAKVISMEARVKVLEDKLEADTNTLPDTGEVTVEFLDEEVPVYLLSSSGGTNVPSFRIVITNGTDDYRYVSYWVNLICVSPDGIAKMTTDNSVTILTLVSPVYGQPNYEYATTLIPKDAAAVQQILFTPATATPRIPVRAGETLKLYHTLELFTEGIEEWEMVLSGVTVSETWGP